MSDPEPEIAEAGQGRPPRYRILAVADAVCAAGAGIVLFSMMSMTFVDVVGRYFLSTPLGFAYEMTQVAMAALVLAAFPSVTLRGLHITIGLFEDAFTGVALLLRDTLIAAAMAASCFYLAWRLSILAGRFVSYGDVTSVLRFPVGYVVWLAVGSFVLSGLFLLVAIADDVRDHARRR